MNLEVDLTEYLDRVSIAGYLAGLLRGIGMRSDVSDEVKKLCKNGYNRYTEVRKSYEPRP